MTNYHNTIRQVAAIINKLVKTQSKPMLISELTLHLRSTFGVGKRSLLNILKDYEEVGLLKVENDEIIFLKSKRERDKVLGVYFEKD